MKIAFVLPGGVDRSGTHNVIPALLWQIERLAQMHELHIFALYQYSERCSYSLLGATVHNLAWPRGRGALVHAMLRLPHLVRALHQLGPFDWVHGWWGQPAIFAAACAGRALKTPVVTTLVGGELIALKNSHYGGMLSVLGKTMTHLALKWSQHIVALSQVLQGEVQALGFRCTVIPLGVDDACFTDAHAMHPTSSTDSFKLLHIASLNRIKDQATLLRAMQLVLAELPNTILDIIGVDTLNGEMQRLAEALGIASRVNFHGFLTQQAIRPFWREAAAFVLSSLHEGQCVAVCEAAAAGVPTVGTRVGILAEWPADMALVVPIGDATALAAGILNLLRDPARRTRIAATTQAWAKAHDADWTAAQLAAIYSGQKI